MSERLVLDFRKAGWSIALDDCDDVSESLRSVLYGWDVQVTAGARRTRFDAAIARTTRGFKWTSSPRRPKPKLWGDIPPKTAMNVVSDIHDVFFDWFLLDRPSWPCLHAAAVEIGGRLVCIPAVGQSGKSSLCVELTARGCRLFCDDVLPIDPATGDGFAMGIAPMMRRPLPASPRAKLAEFASQRMGLRHRRWMYIALAKDEIAPFGARAPIGAVVLLNRKSAARAQLEPLSPAVALREMLLQDFGGRGNRGLALASLHSVLAGARCFRLTYSDLADAAGTLLADARLTRRRGRAK